MTFAGSETSLNPDSDSDDDSNDSSDDSDDDSSVAEEEAAGISTSYLQLISQYEEEGPTLANRGDSAKAMIRTEQKKWTDPVELRQTNSDKFCTVLIKELHVKDPAAKPFDPDELLKKCHAPTFKGYLKWRCNHSRIKKESSIWIPVVLVPLVGLDSSIKNKSGLYVGDLDLILHHHWVLDQYVLAHERLRVQTAVALILAGATASRPGALIEKLCYKDVEFHIFPPAPGSKRARIGMVLTLRKTKRTAGKLRLKKFGCYEEDTLLRDPLLYIESLAFADGAFKNDFKSPEHIYNLIVLADQPCLILP
ncbi:hypothetical protein QBC46DRAFT_453803 [Diplogelasinospora grovesii]|uniref:Uncharacterized protein n=1 Tax=Diplogelasinospora grovesii TaxID=303347 RepID=A0AAN6MWV8_9PEZI|nr:hypothetical protein QBC46DRAFT_453803 [Diplogelasinospora grovesii]